MVVSDSEATRRDLCRLTTRAADRAPVIYCGLNYPYSPLSRGDARRTIADAFSRRRLKGFEGPFLLHVGADHWYKNRDGVLSIYFALRKEIRNRGAKTPKLLLIGPPLSAKTKARCCEQGFGADVIVMHAVSNPELQAVYSLAELLIFPSLEEGFGWPIIEAQACGCRVATTAKAPMTEVGGDAAVYLHPRDVSGPSTGGSLRAARRITELLDEDAEARHSRVARGLQNARRFATAKMIAAYVDVYRTLGARCDRVLSEP
jgi:glycosyltransferase involved in cell wall biosynthesis